MACNSSQLWPFRCGCSSCCLQGSLVDNVNYASSRATNVELLLYDTGQCCNFPDEAAISQLLALAEQHGLTYTVHLPCTLGGLVLGKDNFAQQLRLVERSLLVARALHPVSYVWHWEAEQYGPLPAANIERWRQAWFELAQAVVELKLVEPERICVENLSYDYAYVYPLAHSLGLSVAFDLGHMWCGNFEQEDYQRRYLRQARVVHLHALDAQGQDHRSLKYANRESLRSFLRQLRALAAEKPELVVTIEVFDAASYESSLDTLRELL